MSTYLTPRGFRGLVDPFNHLQNEINRLFDGDISFKTPDAFVPHIEVIDKEDHLEFNAELPGVAKEDVKILLVDNILTIKGEKKQIKESHKNYYVSERYYGSFERSFRLPFNAQSENVNAEFQHGILKISVNKPKTDQKQSSEITIK